MKKRNILMGVLLVSLLISVVFSLVPDEYKDSKENTLTKLTSLNSKYGLTDAEILAENNMTSSLLVFKADTFKADIISLFKPKKDIILKLDDGCCFEEKDLENIIFLEFRTFSDIEEIISEYENLNLVKYAEPNLDVELNEIKVMTIRENSERDINLSLNEKRETIVAVIDSGVDMDHPDLQNRLVDGWSTFNNSEKVEDKEGHGTHITGIVLTNSSTAKVMPLKFTNGDTGKMKNLIKAIKYAADEGADIINLSLGLEKYSRILKEAIDYAEGKGIIVVAAAGNYKSDEKYYPAALENVISVAALKKNGKKLYISNYGEWVDFSTSAQDVYSTIPDDTYGYGTGTSQAAPVISAVAADLISIFYEENSEKPTFEYIYEYLEEISVSPEGRFADELGGRIPNQYDE